MSIETLVDQVKAQNWDSPATATALGPAALPTLTNLAQDPAPEIRQLSLACLAALGGDKAIETALNCLKDADADVVAEAVALLHQHPPLKQEETLFQAYQDTDDPYAREQIPIIAGRLDKQASVRLWIKEMDRQENTGFVDDGLVTGLARLGYQPARDLFVTRLLAAQGRRCPTWIDRCRYMEQTWIVPHMIPLLDRTEFALSLDPDEPDSYLRTCDLAVEAIVELTQAEVGFPVKRMERYTGPELGRVKEIASKY